MRNKKLLSILAIASLGGVLASTNMHQTNTLSNQKQISSSKNKILLSTTSNTGAVINGNNKLVLYGISSGKGIVSYLSVGEMLSIYGQEGDFYKVKVQETGAIGYISTTNLKKITNGLNDKFKKENFNSSIINVTTDVHLRAKPTMASNIITSLKNGDNILVIGKQGPWYKVNINGNIGYIYDLYVSKPLSSSQSNNTTSINNSSSTNDISSANNSTSTNNNISTSNDNLINNGTSTNSNTNEDNYHKSAIIVSPNGDVGVYKEAGNNSSLIEKLKNGDKVTVLSKDGSLYKIQFDGDKEGYINIEFVKFTDSSKVDVAIIGNSNGQAVPVYEDPSTQTQRLGFLNPNTELNLIKKVGNWYEISYQNKTAYIPAEFVIFK